MNPSIRKILDELGLGDKEAIVFSLLLENGPLSAAIIAKLSKLNRTTVYGLLKTLSDRGLISLNSKERINRYEAIAPERMPGFIERKREALLDTKKEMENLVPQLKLLRLKGKNLPNVQFFDGEEGVKQAYEDTLESNKEKFLRNITGVDSVFKRLGEEWIEYYLKKRTKLEIDCKNLAPKSEWALKSKGDDSKYRRVTKFLPAQFSFDAELDIYDNKVGVFSYAKEHPAAVIIEDETIAHMMGQLFDYMEQTAKGS